MGIIEIKIFVIESTSYKQAVNLVVCLLIVILRYKLYKMSSSIMSISAEL